MSWYYQYNYLIIEYLILEYNHKLTETNNNNKIFLLLCLCIMPITK